MRYLLAILLFASPVMAQTTRITSGDAASDGLVGWWPMEDNSTTTPDRSGTGNTGTLTASPPTVGGKFGNALSFNGSTQNVDIPDLLAGDDTKTFLFWCKPAILNPTTFGGVFILLKAGGEESIYHTATGILGYKEGIYSSGHEVSATGAGLNLTVGKWQQVAVVRNGLNVVFYNGTVSGVGLRNTGSAGFASGVPVLEAIKIGAASVSRGNFSGSIDDVRIYNRALSAAEISALYHSRKHIYGGQ